MLDKFFMQILDMTKISSVVILVVILSGLVLKKAPNTLEDLYFGSISPNTQDMAPDSELKQAVDRVAHYEDRLMEQLDKTKQTILIKLIRSQHEIDSITARENFIPGFRLGQANGRVHG